MVNLILRLLAHWEAARWRKVADRRLALRRKANRVWGSRQRRVVRPPSGERATVYVECSSIPTLPQEWSGSPDPLDPDNYWIDDKTQKRRKA